MKRFEDYNPIPLFIYFVGVALPAMFVMEPGLLFISFAGALALFINLSGVAAVKSILWYLALPIASGIINPLFNHNGVTVLFFINDSAITLEAFTYGLVIGLMLMAVLLWFRSFSIIMTSDKLLYIFGSVSPKLALILSMVLRYIPLYKRQIKKVNQAGRAMGMYKDDNLIDKARAGLKVFGVMVTWGLENGVITAESMSARGYGVGKRSRYALYKWRPMDVAVLALCVIASALVMIFIANDFIYINWFPSISYSVNAARIAGYALYAALAFLPIIINVREALYWKRLTSKI